MLESEHRDKVVSLFIGIVVIEVLGAVLWKAWPKIQLSLDKHITLVLQLLKYGY